MRSLPLSAKVALWSFALAMATMGGAHCVTSFMLRQELMSVLTQRLERVARDVLATLEHLPESASGSAPAITKEMMPKSVSSLPIEITGPDGAVLYHAQSLKNKTLGGGPATPHEALIGKFTYHVETYEQRGLTLRIGTPLSSIETSLQRLRNASLVALPFVAILSLFGGYWISGRALKPVRKITEAAARISAEDLHQRLPVPGARDEIRMLSNVLNDTFERLERSYLQAVRFASDASHQLKTPVTVMRAAIEALLSDSNLRPEQAAVLNDLLDQTRRLTSLSEALLLLARADAGGIRAQPGEADLLPIIERCIEDAEVLGSNQEIRIEHELPARLHALADAQQTEQILLNLLENAVKYNRHGGVIRVTAGERRDGVFITISNTGEPIPPERKQWIFDRFARGDSNESRSGHGLGLSIARELASAQGGDVRLVRSDAECTEFELRLVPAASGKADGPMTPLLTPPPARAEMLRIPG
ncbi:MAG: ATP-binding protein [Chthoniobacteraceae bacterium]